MRVVTRTEELEFLELNLPPEAWGAASVRALVSQQCGLGLTLRVDAIYGK